jgi:hypothetical protein
MKKLIKILLTSAVLTNIILAATPRIDPDSNLITKISFRTGHVIDSISFTSLNAATGAELTEGVGGVGGAGTQIFVLEPYEKIRTIRVFPQDPSWGCIGGLDIETDRKEFKSGGCHHGRMIENRFAAGEYIKEIICGGHRFFCSIQIKTNRQTFDVIGYPADARKTISISNICTEAYRTEHHRYLDTKRDQATLDVTHIARVVKALADFPDLQAVERARAMTIINTFPEGDARHAHIKRAYDAILAVAAPIVPGAAALAFARMAADRL